MTKNEIIRAIAARQKMAVPEVESVVDGFLDLIGLALTCGDDVKLMNFGKFAVRNRKPAQRRNPRTGEPVYVPAKTALSFKAAPALRTRVDGSMSESARYASEEDEERN